MNKNILSIIVCGMMLFAAGCATVTIEGGGNEDDVFSKPITVHGSMYGFAWDASKDVVLAQKETPKQTKKNNTESNQKKNPRLFPMYSVKAHTNYLYLLTGVLSFGLYYPQTFEYKLMVPEKADDENEESYNPLKKKKSGGK
jgi:hypothetical protein